MDGKIVPTTDFPIGLDEPLARCAAWKSRAAIVCEFFYRYASVSVALSVKGCAVAR